MFSFEEIKHLILTKYGLFSDGRDLYNLQYKDYINSTGLWQQPEELASLIHYLQDKSIKTFLNIGTFNGATLDCIVSFLPTIETCISIDPIEHDLLFKNDKVLYLKIISDQLKYLSFDLVFIDGDHSYDSTKNDFYNAGQFAKYCVFHDIHDDFILNNLDGGCTRFWQDIKNNYSHIEYISQDKPSNNMGIGILLLNGIKYV